MIPSTSKRTATVVVRVGLALALLVAAIVMLSSGASAQQPGSVTVTPATGLIDGQYVEVSWSGYPESGLVYLRQCSLNPRSVGDCSKALANGISRQDGSGVYYFKVRADVFVEEGFTCDHRNPCSIGVFIDEQDVKSASFSRLDFAFPPTSCPGTGGDFAAGSGSSGVQRAMLTWLAKACLAPYSLSLSYAQKNSPEGRLDFIKGITDYGMTGSPATETDLVEAKAAKRPFTYAPAAVSGMAFAYNLQDRKTGERITDLKLTPDLLAMLFTGQIANWNDARIKELNPEHSLPSIVRAIGRADNSATTLLVTSWFDQIATAAYEAGGSKYSGPTELYPSTGDIELRTGAETVAREIASPSQDTDLTQFGFIGWVDTSYADLFGLPTVKVRNAAGQFVQPTPESLQAALSEALPGAVEPFIEPNFASTNPAVYPLLKVTYGVLPRFEIDPAKAKIIKSFFNYVVTEGQKVLPRGYIPLSESLVAAAQRAIKAVPVVDVPSKGGGSGPQAPPADGGFGSIDPGDLSSSGSPTLENILADDPPISGSDGGVEPDPVALQAAPVQAFRSSEARLILPALAILAAIAIVLGPALQLASRPELVRSSVTRARSMVRVPRRKR